jgi:hypothetical protein
VHTHHPHPDPPDLTLIDGGQSSPQGLVPLPPDSGEWGEHSAPSIFPRRPGDHLELWTFNAEGTIREIRRASRERGLNPDTAITLVCERRLASAELEASAMAALDEAAMTTEAPLSMWGANRAYLRSLRHGDPLERASQVPLGVPDAAVPIRLLDRLGDGEILADPLLHGELESAIRWEVAALCAGRLIGEWALTTALAARTAGGLLAAAR